MIYDSEIVYRLYKASKNYLTLTSALGLIRSPLGFSEQLSNHDIAF